MFVNQKWDLLCALEGAWSNNIPHLVEERNTLKILMAAGSQARRYQVLIPLKLWSYSSSYFSVLRLWRSWCGLTQARVERNCFT
jgi:hypothetical protein